MLEILSSGRLILTNVFNLRFLSVAEEAGRKREKQRWIVKFSGIYISDFIFFLQVMVVGSYRKGKAALYVKKAYVLDMKHLLLESRNTWLK